MSESSVHLSQSAIQCALDYMYYPMTPYRARIFSEVLAHVKGKDILDLGCGQGGVYWALSYCFDCRSISFFDYYEENLEEINRQLTSISPEFLEQNFGKTIEFLSQKRLIPSQSTPFDIACHLLDKVEIVKQFDFRINSTTRTFDTVLAIESLECVNSLEELMSVLQVCHELLREGGQLVGIAARYDTFTDRTQELIDARFAGALNPDEDMLLKAFLESGFSVIDVKTVSTPELHNYSHAVLFNVTKK